LFFIVIILFPPGGLAGLTMMHAPIVRTKAFRGVLRAYAIAFVPAIVMGIGAVLLIEMSYRLSTQPELGTTMRLFWVRMDAATPWAWIAATLLLIVGFQIFRRTWRYVAAAWTRAGDEARTRTSVADTP